MRLFRELRFRKNAAKPDSSPFEHYFTWRKHIDSMRKNGTLWIEETRPKWKTELWIFYVHFFQYFLQYLFDWLDYFYGIAYKFVKRKVRTCRSCRANIKINEIKNDANGFYICKLCLEKYEH